MLIGILQCGHALDSLLEQTGDYDQMFADLLDGHGFTFKTWDVVDMDFPDDGSSADGWIITGSKHGVYEDHAFIPPLESLIRDIHDRGSPMVGICFGHQIIAQALGGTVQKFDGGWAVGHQTYDFANRGTTHLNAWHQDQVLQAPKGAKVLASNDFCANAALLYGDRALTIQAHPEFGGTVVSELVSNRRGTADYPDDLMDRALAQKNAATDAQSIAQDMAAFLKGTFGVAI